MFEQLSGRETKIKRPRLFMLTLAGSLLCWLPGFIKPNLDLPAWIPLLLVSLLSGLSTTLSDGRWLESVIATSAGTFAGLFLGCEIWPDPDPITRSYYGVMVVVITLLSIFVSVISGLVGYKAGKLIGNRRNVIWLALACCAAYGPIALLLTLPLAARRVARIQTLASERFWALKSAIERMNAGQGAPERACDEHALKQSYDGPPFDDNAWQQQRIGENDGFISLRGGGYVFNILCYQAPQAGYVIDAGPEREREDGTRRFCADESGEIGCGVEWSGTRNVCKPCPK